MNQIVKIDPKEFGLEEAKANQIAEQFKPMLEKMVELEKEFNEIISLPIEEKETAKKAKELRQKYVKVRTGTAEIHKTQKAFYLAGGRFVDGWKNAQLFASQGIEEKLEAIEKHAENLERERIDNLKNERAKLLDGYGVENIDVLGLGSMSESVWNNFLSGTKLAYEQKIEAEKKAEQERIEREKAEAEERKRIKEENERLKAEAEAQAKELEIERARVESQRKAAEEKARKEREEIEAKAAQEKAKQDAILKAERQAKEKLEAELKAKEEAEAKARKEAEEKAESELSKGDSEKIKDLISDLEALKTKYTFKSKANQKKYSDVSELLSKIISHINK